MPLLTKTRFEKKSKAKSLSILLAERGCVLLKSKILTTTWFYVVKLRICYSGSSLLREFLRTAKRRILLFKIEDFNKLKGADC